MSTFGPTLKDNDGFGGGSVTAPRRPGLVLLFSCGRPAAKVLPLSGGSVELGRGMFDMEADPLMSRLHGRFYLEGDRFFVIDLGSQNGTASDGKPVAPQQPTEVQKLVRMGGSLLAASWDTVPLTTHGVKCEAERVMGPALQEVLAEAAQAAEVGQTLHITGESGAGKELVASYFHKSGPRREGRFIAVNCAAIPHGLAERLLFGTRRGAYSGADADADGYIQAAAGGTLFLDEVGDLDLAVQAKLLRVLETRELLPLGAARPRAIDLKLCSATNKDLQLQVAAGSFRGDLYYRIGRPDVVLPPLRMRLEEIPWLIDMTVRSSVPGMTVHASFVEGCLLRPWPGNVRELLSEVRRAAYAASRSGTKLLALRHLSPRAGIELAASNQPESEDANAPPVKSSAAVDRARVEEALRAEHGNVTAAAREIGLHRNQLRRLIERYGLDPQSFADDNPKRSN